MKDIFEPIVNQIEDLISQQRVQVKEQNLSIKVSISFEPDIFTILMGALIQAIILVGGLGSSEYLFRRLQATFDGIEVMQPKNAYVYNPFSAGHIKLILRYISRWSAVVRYVSLEYIHTMVLDLII